MIQISPDPIAKPTDFELIPPHKTITLPQQPREIANSLALGLLVSSSLCIVASSRRSFDDDAAVICEMSERESVAASLHLHVRYRCLVQFNAVNVCRLAAA